MDPDALLSELRLLVEALRSYVRGDPCPILGVSPLERQRAALDTLARVEEIGEVLAKRGTDAARCPGHRLTALAQ